MSALQALRFGSYVWPRAPEQLRMQDGRYVQVLQQPGAGETVQDLGNKGRVVSGSGCFLGKGAAQDWQALCACFSQGEPALLCLPDGSTLWARFALLESKGAPRAEWVQYSFAFVEVEQAQEEEASTGYYRAVAGDCIFSAANATGIDAQRLLAANPGLRWANELPAGEELTLP